MPIVAAPAAVKKADSSGTKRPRNDKFDGSSQTQGIEPS